MIREHQRPRTAEKGSVIYFIFLAIVLFAALSFAVAQMLRGDNAVVLSQEKVKTYATQILDYGRIMRQGVQDVRIANSCSPLEISFANSMISGYDHTPANEKCEIFSASGGGVNYMKPVEDWLDMTFSPAPALRGQWFFPRGVCIAGVGSTGADACDTDGEDNEELIAFLPYIKKDICIEINERLGIDNPGDNPPAEGDGDAWGAANPKFIGSQSDQVRLNQDRLMTGCFAGTSGASTPPSGSYTFFQVLLPR